LLPVTYAVVANEESTNVVLSPAASDSVRVFVANWGYHTSIVVEQSSSRNLGPPAYESAPFLEYAWGDRRFYMDSKYAPWSIYATLFLPTESVVYLRARSEPPDESSAVWVYTRKLDAAQANLLTERLEKEFQRDSFGRRLPPYPKAVGYSGTFYRGKAKYIWTHDCNWWTTNKLVQAGLASSSWGVVLASQVSGRVVGFRRIAE
jgi:hypothetical protein